jgi:hypothetical protein
LGGGTMSGLEFLYRIGATTLPESVLAHQTNGALNWKSARYGPMTRFLSSVGALPLPIGLGIEDEEQHTVAATICLIAGIAFSGLYFGLHVLPSTEISIRLDGVPSILAFALGVGGTFVSLRARETKNKLLIVGIMLGLASMTGLMAYRAIKYTQSVLASELEVRQLLEKQALTLDEVTENLSVRDRMIAQQALMAAIEHGVVGSREVEIRTDDGSLRRIREYYVLRR